jgi:hypothetical protein
MTATTTTEKITRERLEELLAQAVAQRGQDYEDVGEGEARQCLYVHNRGSEWARPGCIIGLVYQLHTGQLVPAEYESRSASVLPVWADDEVAKDAERVQEEQDSREPWGKAVREGLVRPEPDSEDEDSGEDYWDEDGY